MDDEIEKLNQETYTYHFFFNHGLFDELVHYQELIDETEKFLADKSEWLQQSTVEEDEDLRFGKKMLYKNVFPNIFWKSILLSLYFLSEDSLDQICKNLNKVNNYNLSLKDLSDSGIFRSSSYLRKVCGVKSPFNSPEWNFMNDLNKIRNALVHSNGIVKGNDNKLIGICAKYEEISLIKVDEDEHSVQFDQAFCRLTLKNMEALFNAIWIAMQRSNVEL